MLLIDFIEKFPDEESAKRYFKVQREKTGIICRKCSSKEHYWIKTREYYVCKQCKTITTLKSGTVMEHSKLPYRYWLVAMHLMTATKKPFSALELQKQLGHKRYEPIWEMVHKLRAVMGLRDTQYTLNNDVEMDEAFIEIVIEDDDNEKLKRGRGSQRQAKVLVMVETKEVPNDKKKGAKSSKTCGHVKMFVMPDLTADSIDKTVQQSIDPNAKVTTDSYRGYTNLKNNIKEHNKLLVPPKEADKLLPWVHTIISNAKRTLLGIFHMIDDDYLQNYLNEFCYKINRRWFGEKMFDRLMIASVSNTWYDKFMYVRG